MKKLFILLSFIIGSEVFEGRLRFGATKASLTENLDFDENSDNAMSLKLIHINGSKFIIVKEGGQALGLSKTGKKLGWIDQARNLYAEPKAHPPDDPLIMMNLIKRNQNMFNLKFNGGYISIDSKFLVVDPPSENVAVYFTLINNKNKPIEIKFNENEDPHKKPPEHAQLDQVLADDSSSKDKTSDKDIKNKGEYEKKIKKLEDKIDVISEKIKEGEKCCSKMDSLANDLKEIKAGMKDKTSLKTKPEIATSSEESNTHNGPKHKKKRRKPRPDSSSEEINGHHRKNRKRRHRSSSEEYYRHRTRPKKHQRFADSSSSTIYIKNIKNKRNNVSERIKPNSTVNPDDLKEALKQLLAEIKPDETKAPQSVYHMPLYTPVKIPRAMVSHSMVQ